MDTIDLSVLLRKSFLKAGKIMGLTISELSHVANCDVIKLDRINPESTEGLRAIYFIRAYKKLYGHFGGDEEGIKHWMSVHNTGTGGVPSCQVQEQDIAGLENIMGYLEHTLQ